MSKCLSDPTKVLKESLFKCLHNDDLISRDEKRRMNSLNEFKLTGWIIFMILQDDTWVGEERRNWEEEIRRKWERRKNTWARFDEGCNISTFFQSVFFTFSSLCSTHYFFLPFFTFFFCFQSIPVCYEEQTSWWCIDLFFPSLLRHVTVSDGFTKDEIVDWMNTLINDSPIVSLTNEQVRLVGLVISERTGESINRDKRTPVRLLWKRGRISCPGRCLHLQNSFFFFLLFYSFFSTSLFFIWFFSS